MRKLLITKDGRNQSYVGANLEGKEKIHSEFTHNYNREWQLREEKYEAQLQGKDDAIEIYRHFQVYLMEVIKEFAPKPTYIEVIGKKDMTENSGINLGDNNQLTGVVGRDLSGHVNVAINALPSSPNQPGIKELLIELQEAIHSSPLPDLDKNDATDEIANLVAAVQTPDEAKKKTKAAKAMRMLKRIGSILPPTAALVTILDQLGKLLGICP